MAAHIDSDYLHACAVSPADARRVDRIIEDRGRILSGTPVPDGEEIFNLRLDPAGVATDQANPRSPITLTLRRDLAPASLDTFIEIFRDGTHTALPAFGRSRGGGGGVIVDLGANEGYYALRMKRLDPGARVIAVEPVAENMELLRRNLQANGISNVDTIEAAVTDRDGTVELETYPHVGTVASTDIGAFPRPWIDPARIRRRQVRSVPLETVLGLAGGEVDILKLDVEGSEEVILRAGAKALGRVWRVVCECHGPERRRAVRDILHAAGFDCIHAEEKRSGDLYFERAGTQR